MKTYSEELEIRRILGKADMLFHDSYPLIIRVAYRNNTLGPLAYYLNRVYINAKKITDLRLIESILAIALHECVNKYCFYIHASRLLDLGYKLKDVEVLTDLFSLPDFIPDREKWQQILKTTYFSFADKRLLAPNYPAIKSLLSRSEYTEYTHILLLAQTLRNLLLFYNDEIDINKEKIINKRRYVSILRDIKDLITFYEESEKMNNPVLTICMFCKNVKKVDGPWVVLEAAVKFLTSESVFSHGVCETCLMEYAQSEN